MEGQAQDWLSKLLTPLLAPLVMLMPELGWLLGHSWVRPAPSCWESAHVPSHLESFWCLGFPDNKRSALLVGEFRAHAPSPPHPRPKYTHLLALQLLLASLHFPPAETQNMAGPTTTHPTSSHLLHSQQPMSSREEREPKGLRRTSEPERGSRMLPFQPNLPPQTQPLPLNTAHCSPIASPQLLFMAKPAAP